MPGELGEAELFFNSLAEDFNTAAPLRWSFILERLSEDQIEPLVEVINSLGFTECEPAEDEEREDQYVIWFAEIRVHSAHSFAERVAEVEQLAAREGLEMSDFAAGRPELS